MNNIFGVLAAAAVGDDNFRLDTGVKTKHVLGADAPDDIEDQPTQEVVVAPAVPVAAAPASAPKEKRVWTRPEIDQLLARDPAIVERGILTLFRLQTADEREAGATRHHNAKGFNSAHARCGTRFARWLMGMDDNNVVRYPPKSLSHPKAGKIFKRYIGEGTVLDRAREICLLHSAQLVLVANGEIVLGD